MPVGTVLKYYRKIILFRQMLEYIYCFNIILSVHAYAPHLAVIQFTSVITHRLEDLLILLYFLAIVHTLFDPRRRESFTKTFRFFSFVLKTPIYHHFVVKHTTDTPGGILKLNFIVFQK